MLLYRFSNLWLFSWDSSVGLATGLTAGVQSPEGERNRSLPHSVQSGSGAHSDFYPIRIRALSLGVKRLGREANR
jgi:hypothetical protein